ncbi:MAG: DUF4338 domain-containing protein, partial [Deltaproteobacteria bacterium]|nr:DUF4338 domain-containing protein [Deltaproteobacteria bacterium]
QRRVRGDWHEHFGYRPLMLETFVDPAHFDGTSYRADQSVSSKAADSAGAVFQDPRFGNAPSLRHVGPDS